jgi:hypothetical protein
MGRDHSPSAMPVGSRNAVGKPAGGSARRDSVFFTSGALVVMIGKCQIVASSSTFSIDLSAPSFDRDMKRESMRRFFLSSVQRSQK